MPGQPHCGKCGVYPRSHDGTRHGQILRAEGDVIGDDRRDDLILRILENRANGAARPPIAFRMDAVMITDRQPQKRDHAFVGGRQPGHDPGQRGLPRPVGPHQTDPLSTGDGQIDAIDGPGPSRIIAETDLGEGQGVLSVGQDSTPVCISGTSPRYAGRI